MKLKRILALVVMLLAVFFIVACGEQGKTNNTTQDTTSAQTQAHVHSFGEWETVKNPTCTTSGEKVRFCTCGDEQRSSIVATGHSFGEWTTQVESTCAQNGAKKRVCSMCKHEELEKLELSNNHTYGEWVIESESTCAQNGVKKHTCSVCKHEETEKLELSSNHTYGEWSEKSAPSCSEFGVKARKCALCLHEETENIEKTDHDVEASSGKCKNCKAQIASPQIELTTSNILEYLDISSNCEKVVVNTGILGNKSGKATVKVTATRLQNVSFNNVTLTIHLETSSSGWLTMGYDIVVPFDGNFTKVYENIPSRIQSYISSTPTFYLTVKSVTGYVTKN